MIQALALAASLMSTQPVFCRETLVWDANPLAIGYTVLASFTGPDGIVYFQHWETTEAKCLLVTPYGRKCMVTVAALYEKANGDVYSLESEPFEFEGCASRRKK